MSEAQHNSGTTTLPRPVNRSGEELLMRDMIGPELRRRWPDARIIHELPLRYSSRRIDMAAVTETELVTVEIKSSRDVMDRLDAQLRAFAPISHRLIVALAPRWNAIEPERGERRGERSAQDLVSAIGADWIETWTCCAESGEVQRAGGGYAANAYPWVGQMLHMLHVAELHRICGDHSLPGQPRHTHQQLVGLCADYLKGKQAVRAVCRALRARDGFGAASDAPIERVTDV